MKNHLPIAILVIGSLVTAMGQTRSEPVWTEVDRKFLLDNLVRSREEILNETKA